MRRHFELLEEDERFLDELGLHWEALIDGDWWLIIKGLIVPVGYNESFVDMCFRISGYPTGEMDMAYFYPALTRKNGSVIPNTSEIIIDGKKYQQWSRHKPWRTGVDCIESHFVTFTQCIESEAA